MQHVIRHSLRASLADCARLASKLTRFTRQEVALWEQDRRLIVASSDDHRLHEFSMLIHDCPEPVLGNRVISLEHQVAGAIARALEKGKDYDGVEICYQESSNELTFKTVEGLRLIAPVIPAKHAEHVHELSRRFSELAYESQLCDIPCQGDLINLVKKCKGDFIVDAETILEAKSMTGKPEVTLCGRYLRDAIEAAEEALKSSSKTDRVFSISVDEPKAPARIETNQAYALAFRAYIMPVRMHGHTSSA